MPPIIGFTEDHALSVRDMLDRFSACGFDLSLISEVCYHPMDQYHGLVEPYAHNQAVAAKVLISSPLPFTLAHEFAHAADVALRPQETLRQVKAKESTEWHLAHRMSSEYIANRIAATMVSEEECLHAFQGDYLGLRQALAAQDWANFCINYALLLGLFHGLGRQDCNPLAGLEVPAHIEQALSQFKDGAHALMNHFEMMDMEKAA